MGDRVQVCGGRQAVSRPSERSKHPRHRSQISIPLEGRSFPDLLAIIIVIMIIIVAIIINIIIIIIINIISSVLPASTHGGYANTLRSTSNKTQFPSSANAFHFLCLPHSYYQLALYQLGPGALRESAQARSLMFNRAFDDSVWLLLDTAALLRLCFH